MPRSLVPTRYQVNTMLLNVHEAHKALCLNATATHCSALDWGEGHSCAKAIAYYSKYYFSYMTASQ